MTAERPSSPPPTPPRRGCLARVLRRTTWLLLGLVLLLGSLWLLRNRLLAPLVIEFAQGIATRELHGELEIDSLEGDWFRGVTIHGLRFRRSGDEGPIETIEDGELRVDYSLLGLLRDRAGWLEGVSLRARELRLDLTGSDRDDQEEEEEKAEAGRLERSLLARPPALEIGIGRLVVRQAEDRILESESLQVETPAGNSPPRYLVHADRFSARGAAPRIQPVPLDATLLHDGGALRIEELSLGDSFAIRGGRFDLGGNEAGAITWDLPLVIGDRTGSLSGSRDEERIEARLEVQNASLADLALFLEGDDGSPVTGSVSVTAEIDLPHDAPAEGEVRFETSAVELAFGGRRFERLDLCASLRGELLRIDELTLCCGENRIVAREIEAPLDNPDPLEILRHAAGRLEFHLPDVPRLAEGEQRASLAEKLPPHLVEVTARMEEGTFELETGRILTSGGTFDVRRGRIELGDDLDRIFEDAVVDLDFHVAFEDLGTLGEILGHDDWGGALLGELVLTGPLLAPEGRLVAHARDAVASGVAVEEAEATILAHEGRIRVQRLLVRSGEWSAEAEGEYDTLSGELSAVRLEARCPELNPLTAGKVHGSATLLVAAAGPIAKLEGDLVIHGTDLGGERLRADELSLAGRIEGSSVRIEELVITSDEGRVRAEGRVRRDMESGDLTIGIDALDLWRDAQHLRLEHPALVEITDGAIAIDSLQLRDDADHLRLSLTHRRDVTSAELRLEAFDATAFLEPLLEHSAASDLVLSPIDAQVELLFGPDQQRLEVQFAVEQLTAGSGELPWSVAARVRFEDSVLEIEEFRAAQERLGRISVRGTLPLDPVGEALLPPGDLALTIEADAEELERWPTAFWGDRATLAGRATIAASIEGSWRKPRGSIGVRGHHLVLGEARRGREEIGPLSLDLGLILGEGIRIESGELRSEELGHVTLLGEIDAPLDLPALLASGIDPLLDASLALRAELDLPDLSWIAPRRPEVRRAAGRITGTIDLEGTLRHPRPAGRVLLEEGELRLTSAFPTMRALTGGLSLERDRIRIDHFTGEFGSSPFELTGSLAIDGDEPELELTLAGSDLLLYRTTDTLVRADANLVVHGPLSALRTEGELLLTDGRFARDIDLFAALQGEAAPPSAQRGLDLTLATDPPLAGMVFDLEIRARKPFLLRNNLIQGTLRPDLRLVGTGEVPRLQGRVYIDETRVSLPSGPMQVNSGLLLFGEANPFVPTLELNGEARIKGHSIRIRIAGDYDDPEIELSSVPPLANEDLAILFLTGQLPEKSIGERGRGAAQSVAVYVAQDIVKRWFSEGGTDFEESILERIEIEFGTDITRSGASTARIVYLLNARTRGAKRERYIVGERDTWDHINFGYGFRFRFR
jgi:hypothetical protein